VAATDGLAEAMARVGDRWSLLVVDALLDGAHRFGELQAAIPEVATNVLSSRLKQLETERLVVARPYSERPLRRTYELTEAGAELAGALRLLSSWGARASGRAGRVRHDACGAELDVRWWCASCRQAVDPERVDVEWV
jgi:DNA-binding HxlR family transcriptional regulator